MKILVLALSTNTTGGTGRNAGNIKGALEASGHKIELLGYDGHFWQHVRNVRAKAKSNDIVYAIDVNPLGYIAYLATRFTRAKLVIVAQAAYAVAPLYNWKRAFFTRLVYRSADVIVSGSQYVADEIHKKVSNVPIEIIDPGIDISQFSSDGEHHTSGETPFLLGVGAVKARKGYNVSLRAFALAKKDFPSLRYVIVGSQTNQPGFFQKMTELARELGVEKDVDFKTNVADPELKDLYNRASIFILTSINQGFHFEGFGMVFLEAAAYGIPCIGTLGNGIADAVEDGKTGLLVPQNDPEATATAIRKILGDAVLAESMSARARAFAREHDLSHLVQRYEELNQNIMQA